MYFLKINIILLVLVYLVCIPAVDASEVRIHSDHTDLHVGDTITLEVFLDSEDQIFNAVEADIVFPSELLTLKKIEDKDSSVTFWVEKPKYDGQSKIHFSGITPGGFTSSDARLLELQFEVIKEGQSAVLIQNSKTLLHDGSGTEVIARAGNVHIAVTQGSSTILASGYQDRELPEDFTPVIITDPDVFDGESFLVFATEDKGSGIQSYEIKEGLFGRYKQGVSPYKINHQTLNRKIFVKAIDNEGNERIAIVYPQNKEPWHQNKSVIFSILIVCVLTLIPLLIFIRKRQKPYSV